MKWKVRKGEGGLLADGGCPAAIGSLVSRRQ